jgi:hypothetical protein
MLSGSDNPSRMKNAAAWFHDKRGYVYYVLLVAATLFFFWNTGYIHTSIAWMLEAKSIVEDGDIDLSNNWDCTPDSNNIIMYGCIVSHNGKAFSKYPVGRSLFLVPQYAAVHHLIAALPHGLAEKIRRFDPHGYWVLKNTAAFTNIFATIIASLLILLSVQSMGKGFGAGVFAGLIYVFCTSMFTYTASTLIEPVSAMWISLGFYSWITYRFKKRRAGAGYAYLAFSLAFLASPQSMVLVLCCLLLNLAEKQVATAARGLAAGAVPVLLYCGHNFIRFGTYFTTGYTQRELVTALLAVGVMVVLIAAVAAFGKVVKRDLNYPRLALVFSAIALAAAAIREPWDVFGFSISPTLGMLVYSPVVGLAVPGWWLVYRADKKAGTEFATVFCVLAAFLMVFTFEIDFVLARFTSELLPLLCIAAGAAFVRLKRTFIPQALATLGAAMQLLVSVDNVNNYSFWSHLEKGLVIPPYPQLLFWHYSLLRYKLLRLHESLLQIPQFIHHPQAFDNTLFFNSYWFVVYYQELSLPAILAVMALLSGVAVFSAFRLRQTIKTG